MGQTVPELRQRIAIDKPTSERDRCFLFYRQTSSRHLATQVGPAKVRPGPFGLSHPLPVCPFTDKQIPNIQAANILRSAVGAGQRLRQGPFVVAAKAADN